ncbi:MAG: PAS domain S-box protein [Caulobacter sp.]|nr:PAS domain S-box protein [Caulobacter sp.]
MSRKPTGSAATPFATPRQASLDELRQHFAAIVESSDDAIISKTLDGVITSWNQGAQRLFGYAAEEVVGKSITLLIPEDRQNEEPAIIARLRQGERIDHYETVRRRKDGRLVDISLTVSPIRDAGGAVIGASKIARDITDRRRAVEQQHLVLGEMQHRVKNLAAVIEALARQSKPEGEPAVDAFVKTFLGRVHALLSTGELVVTSSRREADLREVPDKVLKPFVNPSAAGTFRLEGPPLSLPEQVLGSLTLAFHELATNALKYGALSAPDGEVAVTWSVTPGPDGDQVCIAWKETGGPPILDEPARKGFGSRVVRAAVSRERDGETVVAFEPDGLACRFNFVVGPG